MENLKDSPRVESLLYNDSVLFLVTDSLIPKSDCAYNVSALVIPRSDLDGFRQKFIDTYKKLKYRYSTLYHFKQLYRYNILSSDGILMTTGWYLSMDSSMFKQNHVTDFDRKILMPAKWVVSANHCVKAKVNFQKMQTDSTQIFPNFIMR